MFLSNLTEKLRAFMKNFLLFKRNRKVSKKKLRKKDD